MLRLIAIGVFVTFLISPSAGQTLTEYGEIRPDVPIGGAWFGDALAVADDVVVVGAPREPGGGAAYVMVRQPDNTWIQEARITPDSPQLDQEFGTSVAIDGDRIVVGAWLHRVGSVESAGAIYVFDKVGTDWIQTALLVSSDPAPSDYFGWAVSVSGDVIAGGGHRIDHVFSNSGAVHVFRNTPGQGWELEATLTASDPNEFAQFGVTVLVQGDSILIGAYQDDSQRGAVYAFSRELGGDWIETQKITASDVHTTGQFGFTLDRHEDSVLVGSWGAAYVLELEVSSQTWIETALIDYPGSMWETFGASVSLEDDKLAVAALQASVGGEVSGSAHLYERDATGIWNPIGTLVSSGTGSYPEFGISLALHGGLALVGGRRDSGALFHSGAVFLFELDSVSGATFERGDVNGDRSVNLGDAITLLESLFGDPSITCAKAADVTDSGTVDLADVISLLSYLYSGTSSTLAFPGPFGCGFDPTPDGLSCERVVSCP